MSTNLHFSEWIALESQKRFDNFPTKCLPRNDNRNDKRNDKLIVCNWRPKQYKRGCSSEIHWKFRKKIHWTAWRVSSTKWFQNWIQLVSKVDFHFKQIATYSIERYLIETVYLRGSSPFRSWTDGINSWQIRLKRMWLGNSYVQKQK